MLFQGVLLRTRRAPSLYKVYDTNTFLVLNGTLWNRINTLLALSRRCSHVDFKLIGSCGCYPLPPVPSAGTDMEIFPISSLYQFYFGDATQFTGSPEGFLSISQSLYPSAWLLNKDKNLMKKHLLQYEDTFEMLFMSSSVFDCKCRMILFPTWHGLNLLSIILWTYEVCLVTCMTTDMNMYLNNFLSLSFSPQRLVM